MKGIFVFAIALSVGVLLGASGCSNSVDKVQNLLEADGCQNTHVTGWSFFGEFKCDKNDSFNNSFSCVKNGHQVSGYVCGGWFKGMTIRYE